jgi:recombination protein RecR
MHDNLLKLIDSLNSLPGIGKKQAEKIAFYILRQDEYYAKKLVDDIKNAKSTLFCCISCNNLSSHSLCDICSSTTRDRKKLFIVNSLFDIQKIEFTNAYKGLYFSLNSEEINVKKYRNISPEIIEKLKNNLLDNNYEEILIGTSLNINGEATACYISKIITATLQYRVKLFRIGHDKYNSNVNYASVLALNK